jgi:hypothetical protein
MRFILFSTSACHLCDQAEEIIRDCLPASFDQLVEKIDIADAEQWQERYALRIPVLFNCDSKQELCWYFSREDVLRFMEIEAKPALFSPERVKQSG